MKVLHLQIRKDRCVRAMLNETQEVGGHVYTYRSDLLFNDQMAKDYYTRIFESNVIESIHVRVFRVGDGWVPAW